VNYIVVYIICMHACAWMMYFYTWWSVSWYVLPHL